MVRSVPAVSLLYMTKFEDLTRVSIPIVHYVAAFKYRNTKGSILDAVNDPKNFSLDHYNIVKLLEVFLAREIASLPMASRIIVNAVNPGLSTSQLRRDMAPAIQTLVLYARNRSFLLHI